MQRKNNILKKSAYTTNKSGFAMMMALGLVVVMGTIMALTLNISSVSAKRSTDSYLHEQALLLTRSATEYALLAISGNDRNNVQCLNNFSIDYPDSGTTTRLFTAQVSMYYIGLGGGTCTDYIPNVTTTNSIGDVVMDVTVTSSPNLGIMPIRYHRRTLQKI